MWNTVGIDKKVVMDDKLYDSLQKYVSVYQPALIMFSCFVKLWSMNSVFILP